MAQIERITFTHEEVVETLLKSRGIHEGLWTLSMEFSLDATYVGTSEDCVLPAAIVPVVKIGIRPTNQNMRHQQPAVLSVDAAQVNPSPQRPLPGTAPLTLSGTGTGST